MLDKRSSLFVSTMAAVSASWLLPAAGAAQPAPASMADVEMTLDLDGDGAAEQVRLAPGRLELRARGGARRTVRVPGRPRPATLRAHAVGAARLLAVELEDDSGARLWVGELTAALAVTELAALPLGPQGPDGEYAAGAELVAGQLVRWQERPELRRCDGASLRVLAQAWDPRARRWTALPPPGAGSVDGAVELTAHPAAAPLGGRADVFRARFATSQRGAARADELFPPTELDDGDPRTAWQSADDRDGRGEVLGYVARLAAGKAQRLRIVPGDVRSAAALRASGRPARLVIEGTDRRYRASVPDPVASGAPLGAAYEITLPTPIQGCLSITIEAVHPGNGRSLAIGELAIETDLERTQEGATSALVAAVVKGDAEGAKAALVLAGRGAEAAQALATALAATREVAERRRLAHALIAVAAPQAAAPLAEALRDGWMDETDQAAAVSALARHGAAAALAEVAASAQATRAARLAAVAALGTTGSGQLVTLAGVGDHELRRAVINELTKRPAAELSRAAGEARGASAQGDLWRAAVRSVNAAGLGAAKERGELATELWARWGQASDYERRYRIATALAELAARDGDAASLATLRAKLSRLAVTEPAQAVALTQAVAEVAARHGTAQVATELGALAQAPEPGVRLAAVRGLSGSTDASWPATASSTVDNALTRVLAHDGWPEIRRAAAGTLGGRCARLEPARALRVSLESDPDLDVRQDALLALVTCRASGIAELLQQLWTSDAPAPVRQRAVLAAAMLGDGRLAAPLARALTRWRSEAFSDQHALELALRAAFALGRLGGAAAAPALRAALADSAYPDLVAAAAAGLGELGRACPPEARGELSALSSSPERAVALAARRALARCGAAPQHRATAPDAP